MRRNYYICFVFFFVNFIADPGGKVSFGSEMFEEGGEEEGGEEEDDGPEQDIRDEGAMIIACRTHKHTLQLLTHL